MGVELVPAIEMSCVHEYAEDLHICGYWVDLGKIAPACERAQHERVTRAGEIVEKLREHGFDLHLEDAVREAGDALSIGRPHIARAAGATGDLGPFFEEYLVPGAKAFVPRRWPTAEQAIELIREAGGVAVIAHPYWDISEPDRGGRPDPLPRTPTASRPSTRPTPRSRPNTSSSSAPSWTSSPPPPPTTTAPPTRPSPSSAPTTPTAWASRKSRLSRSVFKPFARHPQADPFGELGFADLPGLQGPDHLVDHVRILLRPPRQPAGRQQINCIDIVTLAY